MRSSKMRQMQMNQVACVFAVDSLFPFSVL